MKTSAILAGIFSAMTSISMKAVAQENPTGAICAPGSGEGALYLPACEKLATAGDGHAAMITGSIYWNGDGVPKDNAKAAIWWKMADRDGEPEAPFALGGEAFVRAMQSKGNHETDGDALDEAQRWYQKAVGVDLVATKRQQAQGYINQILKLKSLMPHV
jgi:hypothetical protein